MLAQIRGLLTIVIWFKLAVLSTPAAVAGSTLHVCAARGSDATGKADNSVARPWKTIGRAAWGSADRTNPQPAEAAAAGDVVLVCAGTYETSGTGDRSDPAYNPINSGSQDRPIIFRADGSVSLLLEGRGGPAIGARGRDYIWWDGFTIHEATAPGVPDTGAVVLFSSTGSGIERCTINGNGRQRTTEPTNHTGIRIERSTNITVRNNRITNIDTLGNVANAAGVQVYYSGSLVIEHNEISRVGSGVFLKAPYNDAQSPAVVGPITIRYNLLTDSAYGVVIHRSPARREAPTRVYQNVIRGASTAAFRLWTFSPAGDRSTEPLNAWIVNNTIVQSAMALAVANEHLLEAAGHRFANNIVAHIAGPAVSHAAPPDTLTPPRISFDHNLFHQTPAVAVVAGRRYALSDWQRQYGQDRVAPPSLEADPLFEDAGRADYRLRPGSPARLLGMDMLDLDGDGVVNERTAAGAYVTGKEAIGVAADATAPIR